MRRAVGVKEGFQAEEALRLRKPGGRRQHKARQRIGQYRVALNGPEPRMLRAEDGAGMAYGANGNLKWHTTGFPTLFSNYMTI